MLVDIATDLYTFHRGADVRSATGEVVSRAMLRAARGNPELRRPLEDIRPDIAAVYQSQTGHAASASALGNAMTHLLGKAREAEPDPPTVQEQVDALLGPAGNGQVPPDRGLEAVKRAGDCPLPDGYTVPEPYIVADDGIHLVKHDGSGYARLPGHGSSLRVFVDPARTSFRSRLAGRPLVGQYWSAAITKVGEVGQRGGRRPAGD